MKSWKTATCIFFLFTGVFLGVFMMLRDPKDITDAGAGTSEAILQKQLPLDVEQELPVGDVPGIVNAEPIVLPELITGAQIYPESAPVTEDQKRIIENAQKDFAEILTPEHRDPNSEGNRRMEAEMVQMMARRLQERTTIK